MKNLTAFCEQLTSMVADHNDRTQAAADRIRSLGAELQTAKDAMAAAAAADDMTTYREQEANVRFLSARIQATKQEQVEPLFATLEDALALDRGYQAALHKDLKPVYTRLLETMREQKELVSHLDIRASELSGAAQAIDEHAQKVGSAFHPWHVPSRLLQHFCDTVWVEAVLKEVTGE